MPIELVYLPPDSSAQKNEKKTCSIFHFSLCTTEGP